MRVRADNVESGSDGFRMVERRPRVAVASKGGTKEDVARGRSARLTERIGLFLNISSRSRSSSSAFRANSVSELFLTREVSSSSSLDQASSSSCGVSSSSESPPTMNTIFPFFFGFSLLTSVLVLFKNIFAHPAFAIADLD